MLPSLSILLTASALISPAFSQTSTKCNPIDTTCPPDPALGGTANIDFSSESSQFTSSGGSPSYQSDGVHLTVAQSGDAPTLTSNFYMMFGHVEVVMKAAPGAGIVSSMVLQSDDLDEVDLEWLGADSTQVQSNYFGKGQTTTYNRGAYHPNPDNQNSFHTYTVDFTADQIVWQIDGTTVRAMTPTSAESGQYPQTPMQLKLGIWSGGDPSNPPGTIQWARGPTDYSQGPFTMTVQSVKCIDYSTGTQYTYGDNSGSWQSIKSTGGTINSGGNSAASSAAAAAPSVTEVSSGAPSPFGGTHRGSSTIDTPSVWPWVATATTLQTTGATSIPGVPSGWTVTGSGHVVPPSAAPSTSPPALSSSPSAPPLSSGPALSSNPSPSAPADGQSWLTTTVFNAQGFPTPIVVPPGWSKSYDQQGFLVIPTPTAATDLAINDKAMAEEKAERASVSEKDANPSTLATSVSGVLVAQSASLTAGAGQPTTTAKGGGVALKSSVSLLGVVAFLAALL